MRFRVFAFVLALLFTATPVLAVVCEMDCAKQPPATPACHTSAFSHDGLALRAAEHGCDHDHASRTPARLASASAHDSAGTSITLFAATFAHPAAADARMALVAVHGPPGSSGRRSSSHITVLRI